MRCYPLLAAGFLIVPRWSPVAAQTPTDTMPAHVVERMLAAFDRGDQATRSRLYDSVYYFQNLMVPRAGDPKRPPAKSAEARAREWQGSSGESRVDTLPQRSRKVLQRMVVGRFVVYDVAVVFKPRHEKSSFEKLEIYEVKNGKIVAEYDGQSASSGAPAP